MTKKAIEKLPEQCRHYCEVKKSLIKRSIEGGRERQRVEDAKKLRGYVECLRDMGILTETEMRAVYMYYATI
jgi:hypothetical protein